MGRFLHLGLVHQINPYKTRSLIYYFMSQTEFYVFRQLSTEIQVFLNFWILHVLLKSRLPKQASEMISIMLSSIFEKKKIPRFQIV
jgi:hypothetical protein